MITVDRAFVARKREGWPVRAAVVGAGLTGRPLARQIMQRTPGMEVVAIASRTVSGPGKHSPAPGSTTSA